MYCSNCAAEIPDGHTSCLQCFTPLRKHRALLARFLAWLFHSPFGPRLTLPQSTLVHRLEHIEITNPATGDRQVFHSLDDLPPDVRANLDALRATAQPAVIHHTLTFRDPSGVEHTYDSPDQLPPEVRAVYEQIDPAPPC